MRNWRDEELEPVIGHLLRVGVIVSAVIVLAGGFLYLREHAFAVPQYGVFSPETKGARDLAAVARNIRDLNSAGIIGLGILVLLATPIARVLFSVVAFLLQRDYVYVIVTLLVLAVLAWSLLGRGVG